MTSGQAVTPMGAPQDLHSSFCLPRCEGWPVQSGVLEQDAVWSGPMAQQHSGRSAEHVGAWVWVCVSVDRRVCVCLWTGGVCVWTGVMCVSVDKWYVYLWTGGVCGCMAECVDTCIRVAGYEDLAETDALCPQVPAGQPWSPGPEPAPRPLASSEPPQASPRGLQRRRLERPPQAPGAWPLRGRQERVCLPRGPGCWRGRKGGGLCRRASQRSRGAGVGRAGSRAASGVSQGHGSASVPAPPPRGLSLNRAPLRLGSSRVYTGHIAEGSGSSGAPTSISSGGRSWAAGKTPDPKLHVCA